MPEPIVIPPGTGLRFGNLELLVLSEHTPRFNVGIVAVAPDRHGPPVHHHETEDDSFYILEGRLTFIADGEDIDAPAGTFVLIPPGVEHTWHNRSDADVRMLNIHAPAGFDLRMREDG